MRRRVRVSHRLVLAVQLVTTLDRATHRLFDLARSGLILTICGRLAERGAHGAYGFLVRGSIPALTEGILPETKPRPKILRASF